MIKLTDKHRKFICDNLKEPDKLITSNNVDEVLSALDSLMLFEGFDLNDEPTNRGYEIERIRDEIYMNN